MMILPDKHLSEERCLLHIGGEMLQLLFEGPKTVSRLWDELKKQLREESEPLMIGYQWFILVLDFLYIINLIEFQYGKVQRVIN